MSSLDTNNLPAFHSNWTGTNRFTANYLLIQYNYLVPIIYFTSISNTLNLRLRTFRLSTFLTLFMDLPFYN